MAKTSKILQAIDRALNVIQKFDKAIHFLWVESANMAADAYSKDVNNFTPTSLWLNGPKIFLQQLESNTWAHFKNGKFTKAATFKFWNKNCVTNTNPVITRNIKIQKIQELSRTPLMTSLRLGKLKLWCPYETLTVPNLTMESFEEYTGKSNCHLKNVSILASVLEAIAKFKRQAFQSRTIFLKQAHQAILRYAQTLKSIQLTKSYTQQNINQLECIAVNIGESLNISAHTLYLPIVNYPTLAKQILWSAHRQLIPSTPGTPAHFFHLQKML